MKTRIPRFTRLCAAALVGVLALASPARAGDPPVPYAMSTGNYLETFDDIANWANNFASGIGAGPWGSVAVNASGTIPDGVRITAATATFAGSGTSGGVQRGSLTGNPAGTIVLLATGSTDNSSAAAIDLYLDFTDRAAGTLSFDWQAVANSTGNRASSLRVYTSPDGSAWTELAGAAVLNVSNNVAASGSITAVALPASLNGSPTARIRFYQCNGTGGSTGSRAKIAFDNVAVTAAGADIPPAISQHPVGGAYWSPSTVVLTAAATGTAPLSYRWQKDAVDLANGGVYSGANTATLTITGGTSANDGSYRLAVTNLYGNATSDPAAVSFTTPLPTITQQPVGGSFLQGINLQLQVAANTPVLNPPTLSYQWRSNGVDLADGGQVSGANTATLTIAGLVPANAADYSVRVSNSAGGINSDNATVAVTTTGMFAQWNFNGQTNGINPPPSFGAGIASLVNTVNGFIPPTTAGTPYDTPPFGVTNQYWGSSAYPSQGTSNKTTGVQFAASTVGLKNIGVEFYTRITAASSKYSRLQYTTNGTDYVDFPVSSTNTTPASAWDYPPRGFNLSGFPGVRDNPAFGVRIVTEFENTASYGASLDTNYVGASAVYGTGGTYGYDLVTLTGESITSANVPPVISPIANRTNAADAALAVNFTVTGNGPFTVAASSSNQTAIADFQLSPSIAGNNATLQISAGFGNSGIAPIRVMATDAAGDISTTWFYLTVTAADAPPSVTPVPNTNTLVSTPLTVSFVVGDDSPVGDLQISASSANTSLLPNANLSVGGSGANRTLTMTPVAGATGIAPVEITVTDGAFQTASRKFTLMVRPSTTVVFNDFFDYPNGPLVTGSYNLWNTHSGTANQMDVEDGRLNITQNDSEDVNAKLIGEPYAPDSPTRLYSSFTVAFSALPGIGTGTATNGTYFAHFKDDGTSNFRDRIWALTNGAAPGKFRLGVANTSATLPAAIFPLDLDLNTPYTVVTRIVVSNGLCTLWINPTAESSPGVTDATVVAGPVGLTSFAFRQAVGEGTLKLDDLVIGLNFADVVEVIAITGITVSGSTVTITFDGAAADVPADFVLEGSSVVDSTYGPVAATITSPLAGKFQAVTTTSGPTQFYRVKRL
jgi:hypothetical protein